MTTLSTRVLSGYALSPLQLDLLAYADQNARVVIEIRGEADTDRLRAACAAVLERHEILRSSFESLPGMTEPVQVVSAEGAIEWQVHEAQTREEALAILSGVRAPGSGIACTFTKLDAAEYLLAIAVDRLAADERSLTILAGEIAAYYRGTPLGPEEISYAGIASYHVDRLLRRDIADEALWAEPGETAKAILTIEGTDRELLREISISTGEDEAAILLACWASLLARVSGEERLVLGIEVDGRECEEFQETIGVFSRRLPVEYTAGSGSLTESAKWAGASLRSLAERQGESRGNPAFAVGFSYAEMPAPIVCGGIRLAVVSSFAASAPQRIALRCLRHSETLRLEFSAAAAKELADEFGRLLSGALRHLHLPLAALPIRSASFQERLTRRAQGPRLKVSGASIAERIAQQAMAHPTRRAVISQDGEWTYAELLARADGITCALHRHDVTLGDAVGMQLPRSFDGIAAILGIMQSGAAYVPISMAAPAERVEFIRRDARLREILDAESLHGISCNEERPAVRDADGSAPAYIIYTSGSTGEPKGVVVSRRNLLCSTLGRDLAYTNPPELFLLASPLIFDSSVAGLFWTLASGGTLLLPDDDFAQRFPEFLELMRRYPPTHLLCLPTLLDAIVSGGVGLERLTCAIVAGENCPPALPARLAAALPAARLFNEYGPTEATVWSTVQECRAEQAGRVPIGRPVANSAVYLLDSAGEPVPAGVRGEIYVGGELVAAGYAGRPGLTAAAFLPDPFGAPGARMYRTGDIARWNEGGELEFLGRADQQVKVRGHRIELGEIEAALIALDGVRQAAVLCPEDASGEHRLAAYVAPEPDKIVTPARLREGLKARLPEYMIPASIKVIAALPLTETGKVDRKALAEIQDEPDRVSEPETEAEAILVRIWQEVFGQPRIGVDQAFYEAGGDSIRAIQVVARATHAGLPITLQQLAANLTVRELAASVSFSPAPAAPTQAFCLLSPSERERVPADVEDAYPLSRLQAGMLFHAAMSDGPPLYNDLVSYRLRGSFDERAMRHALQQVVHRHPILRASIHEDDFQGPLQMIHQSVEVPLTVSNLRGEARDVFERWFRSRRECNLPLDQAPLISFFVHAWSEDEWDLTYQCPHAILDGWSAAVMLSEIFTVYAAHRQGSSAHLDQPPESTYRDFVALERRAIDSSEARQFWRGEIAGYRAAALPMWPRSESNADGETHNVRNMEIAPETVSSLMALATRIGVSLKSLLLAAHVRVLSYVTGRSDVVSGLVTHGRIEERGGDRVLGLFLNTVPFRIKSGTRTWTAIAKQAAEKEQALLPHRRFPLAEIQAEFGPQPLFDVVFNFNHFHLFEEASTKWGIECLGARGSNLTNFALTASFELQPGADRLHLRLAYRCDRLPEEQIAAIEGYYRQALDHMARHPEQAAEWDDLAIARDRSCVRYTEAKPAQIEGGIHELIEQQVERTPDRVAVKADDRSLTYNELNRRANRLAWLLRSRGLGPEKRAGICLGRSVDLVTAVLAVLKSGAAYVGFDPDAPAERLAWCCDDAQADIIITESRYAARFGEAGAKVLCYGHMAAELDQQPDHNPPPLARSSNLAYIIYTSGSTGRPKGVAGEHRHLAGYLQGILGPLGNPRESSFAMVHNLSVDAPITFLYAALTTGSTLHVIGENDVADPDRFAEYMRRHEIEYLKIAPSHLKTLLGGRSPESVLPSRLLMVGGEASQFDLVRDVYAQRPGCTYLNHYGPTETTCGAMTYDAPANAERCGAKVLPIGHAIDTAEVLILDDDLRRVPAGVPGEIYIGGAGVTRGYLGRPELTAERYIPHPFSERPGTRLYRTGDIGRYLPSAGFEPADGETPVEFFGRTDDQVKIRGFRIELGEIEAVLLRHPSVREAAVKVEKGTEGEPELAAYFTTREALNGDLRQYLMDFLPSHMIPARFCAMAGLPKTPQGKIDRQALKSAEAVHRELVTPRTEVEQALARIWSGLLRGPYGIDDDFFAAGGHSLLAARLVSRVRQELKIEMPLRMVFEAPTIRGLAARLEEAGERRLIQESIAPLVRQPR